MKVVTSVANPSNRSVAADAIGVRWFETDTNDEYIWNGSSWQQVGAGAGGAPVGAEYVVVSLHGTLTDERAATEGSGIDITDAGAGSTLTFALDINGLTSETAVDAAAD